MGNHQYHEYLKEATLTPGEVRKAREADAAAWRKEQEEKKNRKKNQ